MKTSTNPLFFLGIPDYRSEEVGLYARTNHKPIQYQEFLKYSHIRQRYWARNFVGWGIFSKRQPNAIHFSIRNLECDLGKVRTTNDINSTRVIIINNKSLKY